MKREITLYIARVDNWKTELDRLRSQTLPRSKYNVSEERRKRAQAFVKVDDAYRCLLAELLLKKTIQEETGSAVADLRIVQGEYGKPSIPEQPNLHFNLSHSGNIVVCVVDQHPIGVDVEKIRGIDIDVAESCFTHKERILLQGNKQEVLCRFYQLWTLKESYLKALGTGLSRSPLSVELSPLTPDKQHWCTSDGSNYTIQSLNLAEGYAAALCGVDGYATFKNVEYKP